MKLIFIVLLFPIFSFAQNCNFKKETDPFTHVTKITTGFVPFNSTNGIKFSLSVDATPSDIDLFFLITSDQKCFDNESAAVLNYEGDRLKANFKNGGSMNCQGAFHINFRNVATTPSNLQRIASKKINTIRLTGNNNVVTELALKPEEKQILMDMVACIIKESKTLIKQ
jgi:hypothetical protein